MKRILLGVFMLSFLHQLFVTHSVNAEESTTKITLPPGQDDTTVTIKKGSSAEPPEFEIISGTAEIAGDPEPGLKESYASWKTACESWKKEVKELNKDDSILNLNCNAPSSSLLKNGLQVYRSVGTYKLKTRMRTSHGK